MLCTPRHSVLRILRILRTDPSGLPAPSKPFGLHLIGRCPSHPGLTQHLSTGAGGRLLASSRCSPGMLLPVLRCMPPPRHQRIIWPQVSPVPRLRNPGPTHWPPRLEFTWSVKAQTGSLLLAAEFVPVTTVE